MPFIETIAVEQATGEVHAMYERAQANLGYVPNYAKLFSQRPAAMSAWGQLLGTVREHMDSRQYELATLAAAGSLRSSYCSLAHANILGRQFYSIEQVTAIVTDYAGAGLAPAEVTMMEFAAQIARDASAITQADIQELREHGWSDAEIFDIAAVAAARCFFSKLLDALGAEPDAAFLELDEQLRDRLTTGRPISREPVEQLVTAPVRAELASAPTPNV